ncbi:MAG: glycosyltransferase [Anaerolineaceae bacterium]|nr:glycosyltransferase [Anaerolineaceae bacterium]
MSQSASPLVSIVMPTYNGKKYMAEAIQSCFDQTYPHWELVIVDDASTDDSPEYIARYVAMDDRIRSIRHEANKKLPGALNTGVRNMKGAYYTWLSDDDLLRPNALAFMVNYMETHPDVDLMFTDYSEIDTEGKPIRRITVGDPQELGIHNVIGVCHLRRKEVFDKVGYYAEDLFLAEDLDIWVRSMIQCKIMPVHEDLFLYRQHPRSLTSTQQKRVYPLHAEILRRHLPQMYWMTPEKTAYAYLRLAKRAFRFRDYGRTLQYIATAIRYSPTFVVTKSFKKALTPPEVAQVHPS